MQKRIFTSESVTEGHPDKVCDQISDGVLDAILAQDPKARVACECCATTGMVMVMGEISTECYVDIPHVARDTICRIGYGLGVGDHALVSQYHMDLYFESAAMILALITLGKYLETRSKGKTSEAITKLMDLAPKTAAVERGGVETVIPVEEVVVGDTVLVRPGQSVPVDGVILEGNTSIDEAAITGESIPVENQGGRGYHAGPDHPSGRGRKLQ